jgi:hypothetical protein
MPAIPKLDPAQRSIVHELSLFFVGAFVPITVGAIFAASGGGLAAHPLTVPLCMLAPMLSAVAVQKLSGRNVFGATGLGLRMGRLRWWLIAPAFAAVFVLVSLLLSFALSPGLVADHEEMLRNLQHLNVPHNISPSAQIALAVGVTVILAPLINLPILLGEEVGWRGFMNPRLQQLFGRGGLVVGGVIWAIWHLPIILLGHNYPNHPWVGMLVWIPVCICMNILLAQAARRSESVIPCALAHGMMNQIAMLMLSLTVRESSFLDILHGPAGLIGLAVLLLPAAWVYIHGGAPKRVRPSARVRPEAATS